MGAFLAGRLSFNEIPGLIERAMEEVPGAPVEHFSDLYRADERARERTPRWSRR